MNTRHQESRRLRISSSTASSPGDHLRSMYGRTYQGTTAYGRPYTVDEAAARDRAAAVAGVPLGERISGA
jgi:hypothetical protein